MATEGDRASYASKSDAELRALEKDGSLSAADWQAVTDELRRRQQRSAAASAPTSAPASAPVSSAPSGAGEDPRVTRALSELRALLVPGETLEAYAVQRRLFALTRRRMLVAATSGRFICIARGLFGGYTPVDVRWQDLEDARLRVGIFGADLTIVSMNREDLASAGQIGSTIAVVGLRKEQAERVYRVCQAQEQSWREKRRIRDLDELRAKSGGIQLGASAGAAGAAAAGDDDPVARLQRAKEMLNSGLITDAEFESIKAKIVDRL
jgi:hypothetical protein